MDRLISKWMRQALAIMPGLVLFLLVAQFAHASEDPDPVAAMIARVSPAVVRVTTVRPQVQDVDNQGGKVMTGAKTVGTYTAFGSGTSSIRQDTSAPTSMWSMVGFRCSWRPPMACATRRKSSV